MRTVTLKISDRELRNVVAHYFRTVYDENVSPDEIRFSVEMGYNGEMGGKPTPNRCEVIWESN